ncbi:MAG: hypothetical protein EOO50_11825 [Flavobacterium sp.]|nr:MAG: hypothetical protein EOO50_11825 [Flavobacterium sp.]
MVKDYRSIHIASGLLRYDFRRLHRLHRAPGQHNRVHISFGKHFLRPTSLKDISEIRKITSDQNLKVYEFKSSILKSFTNSDAKTPKINANKKPEAKFGLIAMREDSLSVKNLFPNSKNLSSLNLDTSGSAKRKRRSACVATFLSSGID